MCGPSYVFLFDTIYDRVKRLTKRMTSRRGLLVGRVSRGFTARREWVTIASARATEADQSARGTYWNWSRASDDLRGSRSTREISAQTNLSSVSFERTIANRREQTRCETLPSNWCLHFEFDTWNTRVRWISTMCTRSIRNNYKIWEKKYRNLIFNF